MKNGGILRNKGKNDSDTSSNANNTFTDEQMDLLSSQAKRMRSKSSGGISN